MKATIIERQCDNCGKTVRAPNVLMYGGHNFQGWIEVNVTNGSTQLEQLSKPCNFDFCCKECAIEYMKEKM